MLLMALIGVPESEVTSQMTIETQDPTNFVAKKWPLTASLSLLYLGSYHNKRLATESYSSSRHESCIGVSCAAVNDTS